MDGWKERAKREYDELCERVARLRNIVDAYADGQLDFEPNCPLWLLERQLEAMCEYRDILEARNHIEHMW